MPAHHRFHPYEIQTIALFLTFIPAFMAIFLAFAGSHLEALRRSRLPAMVGRWAPRKGRTRQAWG